ncbi:MAG TPA: hypothetical protein VGM25_08535 [Caulobacteraceae bacterium]|jgi:hypothetical protein
MGIKLAWIAVKGGRQEDLLERFGLEEIGETSDEIEADRVLGQTAEGWSVLVTKNLPSDLDKFLGSPVPKEYCLCGMMSEIVMFSEVRGYIDGQLSWSVVHHPEMDKRQVVHGDPPEPFGDIKQRLDAEQAEAGDEQVDYLFDLPMELTGSLCGYRPSEGGIAWTIVDRNKAHSGRAEMPDRSLITAMKAELLPLLWSLGWKPANDDPKLYLEGEIVREIGAKKQTIRFEYGSGPETYINVLYRTTEHPASGPSRQEAGITSKFTRRVPLRKKLPWPFSWVTIAVYPQSEDPVDAAIEKAKADIRAVHDYLTTGTRSPSILIQARWISAEPTGA